MRKRNCEIFFYKIEKCKPFDILIDIFLFLTFYWSFRYKFPLWGAGLGTQLPPVFHRVQRRSSVSQHALFMSHYRRLSEYIRAHYYVCIHTELSGSSDEFLVFTTTPMEPNHDRFAFSTTISWRSLTLCLPLLETDQKRQPHLWPCSR